MFSSATNSNNLSTTTTTLNTSMSHFPQYYFPSPSSSSSQNYLPQPLLPPPSIPPLNQDQDLFFHQNHQYDPTLLLANAAPQTLPLNFGPSSGDSKQDVVHVAAIADGSSLKKPSGPKKDRHSKIFTAQGLRDRRVRLSIEIAREFFDLHDMLGFDKASKTLEWLLRKSKDAIKELSASKTALGSGSKSLSSNNSELDQVFSEVNEADDQTLEGLTAEGSIVNLRAKQSRAKARVRARARARTKESGNKTVVEKCGSSSQISSQLMIRSTSNGQLGQGGFGAELAGRFEPCPLRLRPNQDRSELAAKRTTNYCHNNNNNKYFKFPWSTTNSNYDNDQQHGEPRTMSLGEASNSNAVAYSSSSLLLQNWDINSTVSPRLCVPKRASP